MMRMRPLARREWYLDFHTSEHIPGVGSKFDPQAFAELLRESGSDGCLAKARCHHGWCYYPTKVGEPHPQLVYPDLVGGIIEACRSVDVSPMVYITVAWDEKTAREHPEWLQRYPDGRHVGAAPNEAGWRCLCFNTPYADFVEALWRELLGLYDFDRAFFDIVFYGPEGCSCQWCQDGMRKEGLDPQQRIDRLRYAALVRERFMQRLTAVGQSAKPDVPVYYNNPWRVSASREVCADRFLRHQQFMCIESLPSGGWGYDHFPFQASYYRHKGLDIYSHTGRFHKAWGDFGGLKNPAALEYECLRHAAYGVKTAVGDQLHPSGALEPYTAGCSRRPSRSCGRGRTCSSTRSRRMKLASSRARARTRLTRSARTTRPRRAPCECCWSARCRSASSTASSRNGRCA